MGGGREWGWPVPGLAEARAALGGALGGADAAGAAAVARSLRLAEREAEGAPGARPAAGGGEPQTRLQALVGWFAERLGAGAPEAAAFLAARPRLLRVNPQRLDENHRWLLGVLREGGATPKEAEAEALIAVRRSPPAFELQLAGAQGPPSVVAFLQGDLGLDPAEVRRVCLQSPSLLTQSPEHLRRKAEWLARRLEALGASAGAGGHGLPRPDVGRMVAALPALLNYSLGNLGSKLDYLGAHYLAAARPGDGPALARHLERMPASLAYSLKGRVAPRFAFCRALRIGDPPRREATSSAGGGAAAPASEPPDEEAGQPSSSTRAFAFALHALPATDRAFGKRVGARMRKMRGKGQRGGGRGKRRAGAPAPREPESALWARFQASFQYRLETRGLDAALRGSPEELLAWEDAQAREALAEAKEDLATFAAAPATEAEQTREQEGREGDGKNRAERNPAGGSGRGEYN